MADKNENWVEQNLFPKEEMDSLIVWKPVSNISTDEIYKDLPEVKAYHDNFVRLWLKKGLDREK